jgi:5-bromo-4-chloroindolyl phosphate hydrolysis protein
MNNLITQKNIYIVTTANNIKILKSNLNDYFELEPISFYEGKEFLYKILVPKDCYQKL